MLKELQLQNVSTGVVKDFGPREKYVLESVDWGVAKIDNETIYYFPSEISEEILSYKWAIRHILIIGFVVENTETAIAQASQELTDFIGVQEELKILYNGYFLKFFAPQTVRFSTDERNDNEVLRKFQIKGVCIDPQWYSLTTSETLFEVQV